mmetsp:Transcript_5632/g.9904  ORF Transcript_5632/g.9904 Transcript_5632/m.9904 type:complete len:191 (+) Transcript_5632:99-671(+)
MHNSIWWTTNSTNNTLGFLAAPCPFSALENASNNIRIHQSPSLPKTNNYRQNKSRLHFRGYRLYSTPKDNSFGEYHSNSNDNESDQFDEGLDLYRKGNKSNHYKRDFDKLPFDVEVTGPPPRKLGRFLLDAFANGGDVLVHQENSYVIQSVVFHYVLRDGKFVVNRKTARVKSLARKSIESYLSNIYKSS